MPVQEVLGLSNKTRYIPYRGGEVPPRDVQSMEEEKAEGKEEQGGGGEEEEDIPDKFH
jgi:hypothetical protein